MFGRKRKKTISSTKHQNLRRKQKRFRRILFSILIVVLVVGLSFWSRHPGIVVHDVVIDGAEYADIDLMESQISSALEGSLLFLFPRSNKLLIPRMQIKNIIYRDYLSVENVKINVEGDVLEITLREFEPVASWCNDPFPKYFITEVEHPLSDEANDTETSDDDLAEGDEMEASDQAEMLRDEAEASEDAEESIATYIATDDGASGPKCYFVNSAGLIYMEKPVNQGDDLLRLFNIIKKDPIGQTYVSTFFFRTLEKFNRTLLEDLGIEIIAIYSEDENTFFFVAKEGTRILIDTTDDFSSVANNLSTVMKQQAINEAQFSNIEYIDMRFGSRVFYKLR